MNLRSSRSRRQCQKRITKICSTMPTPRRCLSSRQGECSCTRTNNISSIFTGPFPMKLTQVQCQTWIKFSRDPCHDRCHGLMMLETFSTLPIDELKCKIPDFLDVTQEVTGDPAFSMFNLALKSEWTVKDFCRRLVLKVMKWFYRMTLPLRCPEFRLSKTNP